MIEIRKTDHFLKFMEGLRDHRAKAKIAGRIERLAFGHEGDVAPVGQGLSELRIHFVRATGCISNVMGTL